MNTVLGDIKVNRIIFITAVVLTGLLGWQSALAESQGMHPEVAKALAYQLPKNECQPPKRRKSNVSSGQLRKLERALTRYENCIKDYKADILEDYGQLKESANFGLTQPQADTILKKMGRIQLAIQSKYGLPMTDEQVGEMMRNRAKNK